MVQITLECPDPQWHNCVNPLFLEIEVSTGLKQQEHPYL